MKGTRAWRVTENEVTIQPRGGFMSHGNEYYGQIFRYAIARRDQAPIWNMRYAMSKYISVGCPVHQRSLPSSTLHPRTGTYTRIQKCHGTCGAECVIATTALITATAHAHEPHIVASISKSRSPQSPRSWAGSLAVARTVLPCAHTARGQQRARAADP